jgi:hypothetical protein
MIRKSGNRFSEKIMLKQKIERLLPGRYRAPGHHERSSDST